MSLLDLRHLNYSYDSLYDRLCVRFSVHLSIFLVSLVSNAFGFAIPNEYEKRFAASKETYICDELRGWNPNWGPIREINELIRTVKMYIRHTRAKYSRVLSWRGRGAGKEGITYIINIILKSKLLRLTQWQSVTSLINGVVTPDAECLLAMVSWWD